MVIKIIYSREFLESLILMTNSKRCENGIYHGYHACLVVYPVMVYSYVYLLFCRMVDQVSDSMMALT